jgi:hypothetical protein
MEQNDNGGQAPGKLQRLAEDAVGMVVGAAGGLLSLYPKTAYLGIGISSTAPIVARNAGQYVGMAQAYLAGRAEERVQETAEETRQRLEQKGIADKADTLKDLWTRAIPIIGDDETKAKRDMIRELLVNTAGREDLESALYEAGVAMRYVEEMSGAAAMLFAWIIKDSKPMPLGREEHFGVSIPSEGAFHGVDRQVIWRDLDELKKAGLVDVQQEQDKYRVHLILRGQWLRERIHSEPATLVGT